MIDWVGSVFIRPPDKEMRGLEWGRLYEKYHSNSYNAAELDADIDKLRADPYVNNAKGIYEYLLGGRRTHKLLASGYSTNKTKGAAYEQQTQKAKAGRLQLPAVRARRQRQQDPHLRS